MLKTIILDEKEQICSNCKYFTQHFIWLNEFREYQPINSGHCVYPRTKNRRPCDKACRNWESNYLFMQTDNLNSEQKI